MTKNREHELSSSNSSLLSCEGQRGQRLTLLTLRREEEEESGPADAEAPIRALKRSSGVCDPLTRGQDNNACVSVDATESS